MRQVLFNSFLIPRGETNYILLAPPVSRISPPARGAWHRIQKGCWAGRAPSCKPGLRLAPALQQGLGWHLAPPTGHTGKSSLKSLLAWLSHPFSPRSLPDPYPPFQRQKATLKGDMDTLKETGGHGDSWSCQSPGQSVSRNLREMRQRGQSRIGAGKGDKRESRKGNKGYNQTGEVLEGYMESSWGRKD